MNTNTKMNFDAPTSLLTVKKTTIAITGILTGVMFVAATANAAPEVTINQQASGSTTIVEQSSDGKVATITATPNGITMQDGMPFSVTQIASVPRYTVSQGGINQSNTTVTSVPVTNQVTNKATTVDVITIPGSTVTQALPVTTGNAPVLVNQAVTNQAVTNQAVASQAITNQAGTTQIISTTSLDTLQLKPTFSTPGVVSAQTKIMKILKDRAGKEVAVPANHVAPGDVIEYHTTYTNTTAQPVNDINAVVSLPNGVKLVSLNSPLPTFASTDGNSYQTVNLVGNTAVIQDSYSGLKWDLVNLDSNAAQTVVIRAKVQ